MAEPIRNSSCAIVTRYLGPTNTRGARIKAWMPDQPYMKAVVLPYPHEVAQGMAHHRAARAFMSQYHLEGAYVQASLDRGYVFVFVDNAIGQNVI